MHLDGYVLAHNCLLLGDAHAPETEEKILHGGLSFDSDASSNNVIRFDLRSAGRVPEGFCCHKQLVPLGHMETWRNRCSEAVSRPLRIFRVTRYTDRISDHE